MAVGIFASAIPASAATSPHVSVHTYEAYHYADSYGQAQHYDKVGSTLHLAPYKSPGNWSSQSTCWAGVSSYGYNFKS